MVDKPASSIPEVKKVSAPPRLTSEEEVKKFIGQKLYLARELAGYKQREAAGLIGISTPAITNIENGKHATSVRTLLALALLYDVEPGSLLPGLDSLVK